MLHHMHYLCLTIPVKKLSNVTLILHYITHNSIPNTKEKQLFLYKTYSHYYYNFQNCYLLFNPLELEFNAW